MKLLAWDIETSKVTPEGDDIQAHRPLGICCWAMAWMDGDHLMTFADHGYDGDLNYAPQMSRAECQDLVNLLYTHCRRDEYVLLTHNGVGFDLDILAEESGMYVACADIAMHSIDTCLQIHCLKGFPVGLDAIARGMGLQGKTEGMNGALAPQIWAEGKYDEVLAYVQQDVRSTLAVALEIERRKGLQWISKSGRRNSLSIPRLLTVGDCLKLPEPNTSWMSDPIPRSRFVEWMEVSRGVEAG